MDTLDEEIQSRNFILHLIHGNIPSYSLWDRLTLKKATKDENIIWWCDKLQHNYVLVRNVSAYWIQFYSK